MHRHLDAGLLHEPMVERVVADAMLRRAIDGFERAGLVVAHHVGDALDAACADHVEILLREFRKKGADAAASDHQRAGTPEEIG